MASASYGSTSSGTGLKNNQKSNLQITLNMDMGEGFGCGMCNKLILEKDKCVCFCNECGEYLHPKCAGVQIWEQKAQDEKKYVTLLAPEDLPLSCPHCLSQGIRGGSQIQVVSSIASFGSSEISAHEHMLCKDAGHKLVKKDYGDHVYICSGCQQIGFGRHCACRNESCPVRFHQECKSPRQTITHPAYPKLSFTFNSEPEFLYCRGCKEKHSDTSCNACGMYANGYFYGSQDDTYHLHPRCANLPRQINCGDTGATMVLQHETTSECCYCNSKRVKRGDTKTNQVWSYVSISDGVSLHVACIIKMLSDLEGDVKSVDDRHSRSHLAPVTLYKKVSRDGVVVTHELQVAAARAHAKNKWEDKCTTFLKYAKIALAAIVSAFLGDPTTLFVNLVVALVS